MLLAPPVADAFVYWPNDSTSTIGRANLDGSGVDNRFVKTDVGPCDVATNGKYVYWSGGEGVSFVGRAKIATQAPEDHFIQTADDLACGVAVDDQHLYFNNYASGAIGRANLNGGNVDHTFIAGGVNPQHPFVAGGKIYWTNKGYGCPPGCTVGRASLDGAIVDQSFITGTADPPSGVAADAAHVYWGNGWDAIGRANLDGTAVDQSFIPADGVCDVAVDDNHIYWASYGDEDGGWIGRADLSGGGIDEHFVRTAGGTCGVAVDTLKPSNDFTFTTEPRITCAGTCRVVLVQITFDSDGNVIAEQIMPGELAAAAGQATVARKKPKRLLKTLKTGVRAGKNKLRLKLTKAGRNALQKKGKLRIKTRFRYTPTGGKPHTETKTIRVKLKRR